MSGWCHGHINVSSAPPSARAASLGFGFGFGPGLRYLAMNSSDAKGIWMDSPEFRFRPWHFASGVALRDSLRGLEDKAHFFCASIRKESEAQSLRDRRLKPQDSSKDAGRWPCWRRGIRR